MRGYILSILGIILIGSLIDIILPDGKINKFIKSIYAIFVLAVIINPLTRFIKSSNFLTGITRGDLSVSASTIVYNDIIVNKEKFVESVLKNNGLAGIDIKLQYKIENDEIVVNKCTANIKNLVIDSSKRHINKYDYVRKIIKDCIGLEDEEIVIDE